MIAVILVVGLAGGRFPAVFPGRSLLAYITAAAAAAALFLVSLLAHELAHAIVAGRNDLEVAGITLWLLGGVAQLRSEPRTPGADFRIAVSGPLTSLAAAAVFGAAALAFTARRRHRAGGRVFGYLAGVNVLLALFYLIPAAPLDGGRVLRAALWRWRRDRLTAALTAAQAGECSGTSSSRWARCRSCLGAVSTGCGWS